MDDTYTLKVGCIPEDVEFEIAEEMIKNIDLMIGAFDPVGVYTIPALVNYPLDIECPVKSYEILANPSPRKYHQCVDPIINP